MASENMHTPGPWSVSQMPTTVCDANGNMIADCYVVQYSDDDEDLVDGCLENALLIAAAPDGHEIIKQLEESFTADGLYPRFLPAMRAYLAKVRGGVA